MDNQHDKISGYRRLNQDEIDMMNEAKALEAQCLALHDRVGSRLLTQTATANTAEWQRVNDAQALRWHAIARTDIETGFMALVRSVAQPQPRGEE